MDHVIPGRLTVAFAAVLVLAGCAPATDDGPSEAPTTTTTTTTGSVRPACADLADKGQALLTEVGRYGTGKATGDQVRAAAAELSDSFDSAKTELGPEAQASLDEAGRALQEVLDALTTQPVDSAKLRASAGEVVTALGDAAAVCTSSGTSTEPTSPTSTTDSVTTTS